MKIDEFCKKIDETLALLPANEVRVEAAVKFISLAFSVKLDEVAIFLLDKEGETLSFIWPPKLINSGFIPLSAINPLVAQTVRESRGIFNNSFASVSHASIFELFRIEDAQPLPIQKIVSAPMIYEGKVKGVIQVSRKGEHSAAVGRDFSQNDVFLLQSAAATVAGYL